MKFIALMILILVTREFTQPLKGVSSIQKPMSGTFEEVQAFLAIDPTDQNNYTDKYICWNFGCGLIRNAIRNGIEAHLVGLLLDQPPHHAVVAFNTSDMGTVYVEPQTDKIYLSAWAMEPGIQQIITAECLKE